MAERTENELTDLWVQQKKNGWSSVNAEVASFDVAGKRRQQSKENLQRNIRHLQKRKSRNTRRFFHFFTNLSYPVRSKSKNKPDRAATAADREVAVIPAAPLIPPPPQIPVPAHATRFPVPDKWEIGIKKNTGWIQLPCTYIHTYILLHPISAGYLIN